MSRQSSRSSNRGGWRGRGRATSHVSIPAHSPADKDIKDGLLAVPLETLSIPADTDNTVEITDLQYLGSYNWIDSAQPTIIVPGSPPVWRDKPLPFTVARDSGSRFIDQNKFRLPTCPLLPLFRAVDVMTQNAGADALDWSTVDVVTDRHNLRKLLSWITGTDTTIAFRIDTQLAGARTLLLNCWETRATEDFVYWTYGTTFAQASTTPADGCAQSTAHGRVVKYDLDGMTIVLRHEVHACLPSPPHAAAASTDTDELAQLVSGLNVTSSQGPTGHGSGAELEVIHAGSEVPQSKLVMFNTRSKRTVDQFDLDDLYRSLYLAQTPIHFLAVHDRGNFETVTKRMLGDPEFETVARNAQMGFSKLRRVLQEIQELVVKHGQRGRLTLVCQDGAVRVFERSSQTSCLPESVFERFGI
ncbi:hypothetical protein B0H21DRAFT_823623 [Amylocystis lapponica]|nr:hypothetical protein B0H21DRAFT_823623 [Amylocystis lapponica]